MGTQTASALRHVRTLAPYNAVSFAEQNKALVGKSARLSGFDFVSINVGTDITLGPGTFISTGLALNPTETDRISGIVAETLANVVIPINDVSADFYLFALVQTPSEGTTVDFLSANGPTPPNSQWAPIARYIAGEFILEDALSDAGLEDQVTQAREDSGADQFYLSVDPNTAPATTFSLTAASLPDGTLFPATVGASLTTTATNYIWFNPVLGLVQTNTTGFPTDITPLWEVVLDGSGLVTSKTDRRPWFGGGSATGSGGAPLEGKTFVPQDDGERLVAHFTPGTFGAGGTQASPYIQDYTVDFSAAQGGAIVSPPTGATHAIVRVLFDLDHGDQTSPATRYQQNMSGYLGAYSGSFVSSDDVLVGFSSNEPLPYDAGNTGNEAGFSNDNTGGTKVVPLNTPADPAGDLTVRVEFTGPGNVAGGLDIRVYVEGWLIDELGSSPNPVSFSAFFGAADTQVVPATSNYYIVPASGGITEFNLGGGFNSGDWSFTAPLAGKYAFYASASLTGGTAGEFGIHLQKNPVGSPVVSSDSFIQGSTDEFGTGNTCTAIVTGIFDLAAGDKVYPTINIANPDGGTLGVTRADGRNGTSFQGHLIGVGTLASATSKSYVFRVNPPTGGQNVPAVGQTKVAFGAADFDPDGVWDDGTDRFIAQETGFYHFNGEVQTQNQDTSTSIEASLHVNGTPILRGTAVNNGTFGNQTSLVGGILELEAGDYVELFAGSSSPTPEPIIGGYFSGFRIANTSAPSPIPFQAPVPGTQDLTADQSWQTIDWDVATFDDGAGFNDVANSFSAPSNGKYNIRASISLDQVEPTRFVKIRIVLDGTPLTYTQRTAYNGEASVSVDLEIGTATLLDLNAGQIVTVQGAVSDSNAAELKTVEAGIFEGYLIT